jgi:hypothetical protein
MGLRLHLDKVAYLAMVVGVRYSSFAGFLFEVALPPIKWWWSGLRSFDVAFRKRIKAGRKLLRGTVDHEQLLEWRRNTDVVFVDYLRVSHSIIQRFEEAGRFTIRDEQYSDTMDATILIKQMAALRDIRQTLRNEQDTMVVLHHSSVSVVSWSNGFLHFPTKNKVVHEYHEGPDAAKRLDAAFNKILSVTPEEMKRREEEYQR